AHLPVPKAFAVIKGPIFKSTTSSLGRKTAAAGIRTTYDYFAEPIIFILPKSSSVHRPKGATHLRIDLRGSFGNEQPKRTLVTFQVFPGRLRRRACRTRR